MSKHMTAIINAKAKLDHYDKCLHDAKIELAKAARKCKLVESENVHVRAQASAKFAEAEGEMLTIERKRDMWLNRYRNLANEVRVSKVQ